MHRGKLETFEWRIVRNMYSSDWHVVYCKLQYLHHMMELAFFAILESSRYKGHIQSELEDQHKIETCKKEIIKDWLGNQKIVII